MTLISLTILIVCTRANRRVHEHSLAIDFFSLDKRIVRFADLNTFSSFVFIGKDLQADFALLVTAYALGVGTVGVTVPIIMDIRLPAAFALRWIKRVAAYLKRYRDVAAEGLVFAHASATDGRLQRR